MSDSSSKIVVPPGIPEAYRKGLEENWGLVEELFFSGGGDEEDANVTSTEGEEGSLSWDPIQNMLHFLDVFIDVFNYARKIPLVSRQGEESRVVPVIKGDSPVIQEGIREYREVFRQNFRGVQYLSLQKFKEVSERALRQVMFSFRPESLVQIGNFKKLLVLEKTWLEKINEKRRSTDLEMIRLEAIEKFKAKVLAEFYFLYEEENGENAKRNMTYCEDASFQRKVKRLVIEAKSKFSDEIPFRDQEDLQVIIDICSKFEKDLEETIIKDLEIRNSAKMTVVQSYMDKMVENYVESYATKMAIVLERHPQNKEAIYEEHKKWSMESRPVFNFVTEDDTRFEIGSLEYQSTCYSRYNAKILEKFDELLKIWSANAETGLEACEKEASQEVQKCLEKITGILECFGLEGYAPGFRSHVEGGLANIFSDVKEKNQAQRSALVCEVKLDENFLPIVQKFKIIYAKELIRCVRESMEYPNSVDWGALERSHVAAVKHVEFMYRKEFSTPVQKLTHEIQKFMEALISRAVQNIPEFIGLIRLYYESPVKFKIKYGTEVISRGVFDKRFVQTRFNCLSMISEWKDKSLEELRWEEKERQRIALDSIIVFLEEGKRTGCDCDLSSAFQKKLKFKFGMPSSPPPSIAPPTTAVPTGRFTFRLGEPVESSSSSVSTSHFGLLPKAVPKRRTGSVRKSE